VGRFQSLPKPPAKSGPGLRPSPTMIFSASSSAPPRSPQLRVSLHRISLCDSLAALVLTQDPMLDCSGVSATVAARENALWLLSADSTLTERRYKLFLIHTTVIPWRPLRLGGSKFFAYRRKKDGQFLWPALPKFQRCVINGRFSQLFVAGGVILSCTWSIPAEFHRGATWFRSPLRP
jgi:hypothetical protein